MFIKFDFEKRREYWLLSALSALLGGVLAYTWGVSLVVSIVIGVLLLAVLTLRVHFEENTPLWVSALICGVYSFFIYTMTQFAVGTTTKSVTLIKATLNWAVIYALILLISAACGHIRYGLVSVQALVVILGVINHLVVQTRGMEMQFTDILSMGTAMSVVGGYSFTFSARTVASIFFMLISTLFLFLNRMPKLRKPILRVGSMSVGVVSIVMTALLISTSWGAALIGYQQLPWKMQSSTANGFLVSFIHSISASKVNRPSGYSKDRLQQMLTEYRDVLNNPQSTTPPSTDAPETPENPDVTLPPDQTVKPNDPTVPDQDSEKKPNVIVIMNETFADYSSLAATIGTTFPTDVELMPFFSSLSDDAPNVAKGHAMASVFGGNTANSEFEFLTGNSMAFLPSNTVAYNLFVKQDNAFSVVDIFNKSGYTTVGMHPEPGSNWNRSELYKYFGFDQTYFLESVNGGAGESFVSSTPLTEEDYYRGHVSDSTVYDRIIELYEQKEEGTPLFTFAVTMQNHGGYTSKNFEYTVELEGEGNNASANEYLSSIQNADAALAELIAYFEEAEEETLIVFFGDHQPSLPASFFAEYFGVTDSSTTEQMQVKYTVPYLYWGNFDFECEIGEITSLNYLSSHMLNITGLPKTEYMKIIDLMQTEVVAINAYGWWDKDYVFHSMAEEDSDEVNLLLLYKYLQYNALFDKSDDKLYSWFELDETALLPADKEKTAA